MEIFSDLRNSNLEASRVIALNRAMLARLLLFSKYVFCKYLMDHSSAAPACNAVALRAGKSSQRKKYPPVGYFF